MKIELKVNKGFFTPASDDDLDVLKKLNLSIDEVVTCDILKKRSLKFLRMAHKLCDYFSYHIEKFNNITSHEVLKTLQLEAGVMCEVSLLHDGDNIYSLTKPKSIAFDAMKEEADFRIIMDRIVDYVNNKYWNNQFTSEQIYLQAKNFNIKNIT